jgi:MiaB/RimO family radical SAM methylthiotransferase
LKVSVGSTTKYYIETYGCALSEFDSEIMRSILRGAGYEECGDPREADVIIVNTCAVRLDTEAKIVKRLKELNGLSLQGKKLIVSGCLSKARPSLILRTAPAASLVSPQNVTRILDAATLDRPVYLLDGERDVNFLPKPPTRDSVATVMISEGCLESCSFCETKLARRYLKSYPPRAIVCVVRDLVQGGAREIRLTGQDAAAYGVDLPGKPRLPDLIADILDKVPGEYRLRIGMMTPNQAMEIIDDLLDVYRDERVFKFFHIPVQSGDDRVLKIMNRRYTVAEFKELHSKVKAKYPSSLFATDIIVGHPGEDEEAFMNSVRLVEELKFERVYLAQYSIRPRTASASMPQVPEPVKKERSLRIQEVIKRVGTEIYSSYVGGRFRGLLASRSFREGFSTVRLDNYFPVAVPASTLRSYGEFVDVKITGATYFDLRGVIVS